MPDHQVIPIQYKTHTQETPRGLSDGVLLAIQWTAGAILVFLIGSWLVWWATHLQRKFAEEEIRSACQRLMPDTVQRCVDTVVIQRGGARR